MVLGQLLHLDGADRGCPLYRAIVAKHERASAVAASIERLWQVYRPLATPHFVAEFPRQTQQRLWEMILAVHLLKAGVPLERQPDAAPDVGFQLTDGRRVWVEAVCATPGEPAKPDSIPPLRSVRGTGIAEEMPTREVMLRISQALDAKRRQWQRHLRAGRTASGDVYVVAVNTGLIERTWFGDAQEFTIKTLFPIGDLEIAIDTQTGRVTERRYWSRFAINKLSGASIPTTLFASHEASEVSAILCSSVHAGRLIASDELLDLVCIHNPFAASACPRELFPTANEVIAQPDGPDHLLLRW